MSIHIHKNKKATDLLFTITEELYNKLAVPIEIFDPAAIHLKQENCQNPQLIFSADTLVHYNGKNHQVTFK
ncbi:hypothetical protein FAM09_17235 [Niastella caeni]|uniref:Uncharacterized protein n=1 Tax=Niastella caeni TaxID=2569763 RepID=A0A4S8HSF9_9BACT|nr:hypothetical protein [Niastella caeni]THU38413.1 hypothetical protein FAM09_17235 [Niastella caeni]